MKTKILIVILILLLLGTVGAGLYKAFSNPDNKKISRTGEGSGGGGGGSQGDPPRGTSPEDIAGAKKAVQGRG